MGLKVTAHVLRDLKEHKPMGADEYRRTVADPDLFRNRIAFTTLLKHPDDGLLHCGLTAFDTDILYTFDPKTSSFACLGFPEVSERFEVKIHRSLCLDRDGTIYGGTAGLHDISLRAEGQGGRIFSYRPPENKIEFLGIPCPRDYIQTITLDSERRFVYGFTYPVFKFFKFDLNTGEATDFDYIGSITHISALDDKGRLWGTWHPRKHHLFNYDPTEDRIHWFDFGIPGTEAGANRMYPGAGPVDCMINGGDGFIYIGTTEGTLVRLDPESVEMEFLGKPFPGFRMPAIEVGADGLIYGCGGDDNETLLFTYDRDARVFETIGPIHDDDLGQGCFRTHDLCIFDDTTIFVGETDHPTRAGYLWECRIA